MEEKEKLKPIKLQLDHFFSVLASIIWLALFIVLSLNHFKSWFGDSIIQICVSGGMVNIAITVLLFWFYYSQKWPLMNPLKMHPLDCLVKGVIGVIQLFPLSYMIGIVWQKIVLSLRYALNVDCEEQPMLVFLRSDLTHEGQFWGIILLAVILAPIAEEIFFRYFLYRFGKSHMSSRQITLLTAFIFALLHFNLAAFASLWVMGIFLTFLYEYYGNLIPCIIAHSLFNCVSILSAVLFS
ncbi:MAG: CPBP family intramembrane metalloprotease [Puniceicoccales bacterium]|jgi:membrane protease YdiL (CAAX protease family)|nr:CPBP family intramembrane metalloprotease [Puniceicoccales bacterium]